MKNRTVRLARLIDPQRKMPFADIRAPLDRTSSQVVGGAIQQCVDARKLADGRGAGAGKTSPERTATWN